MDFVYYSRGDITVTRDFSISTTRSFSLRFVNASPYCTAVFLVSNAGICTAALSFIGIVRAALLMDNKVRALLLMDDKGKHLSLLSTAFSFVNALEMEQ